MHFTIIKKIFDEANIAYPDDTWTWDTWREVAKKLTNKDKNIYGMAAPVTWQGGYYETLLQSGGAPFAEDGQSLVFLIKNDSWRTVLV